MKYLLIAIAFPVISFAQASTEKQLVGLPITVAPDHIDSNQYYLIAEKPPIVNLQPNQTFILQSSWKKEGDSVVTIGAGTVSEIKDYVGLRVTAYPGKTIKMGDLALFLVPLKKPEVDTLFFKLARYAIGFKTVEDSSFFDRNSMLNDPSSYPTGKLLEAMAADIRYTGSAMLSQKDAQDMPVTSGPYKGQQLFMLMKKINAEDVYQFIRYVYVRPDKYRANEWKVSETFATWVINGAPRVI